MVIVLIHWRIKPEHVNDFQDYSKRNANIANRSGLVGEFLSEPMSADGLPFKAFDLSPDAGENPFISFVNVGFWRDWQAFHSEVAKFFDDQGPTLPFEQYRRIRTILEPRSWRIGEHEFPKNDYLRLDKTP